MTEIVRDDFRQPDDEGQPGRETGPRTVAQRRRATALKAVREAPSRTAYAYPIDPVGDLTGEQPEVGEHEQELATLRATVAELDLRVREQVEIERMRDLELRSLEQELEQKSQRLAAAEIELFHERRRSAELDRRWNVLNALFEDTASSLVETGATLNAISSQRSYRAIVALVRMLRRHRSTEALLGRVSRRAHADRVDHTV